MFKVLEQIKRLVYKLKLLLHWKVHSVISITYLEFYRTDVFNYSWSSHFDVIYMKEDMNEYRSYIIKKLINKSVQIIHRKSQIKYLVHWFDYNLKYNMWYFIENLQNMQKLIKKYEQLYNAHKNSIEQSTKISKHRKRLSKKW